MNVADIKKAHVKFKRRTGYPINSEMIDFLIEKAEKVEGLEKENEGLRKLIDKNITIKINVPKEGNMKYLNEHSNE